MPTCMSAPVKKSITLAGLPGISSRVFGQAEDTSISAAEGNPQSHRRELPGSDFQRANGLASRAVNRNQDGRRKSCSAFVAIFTPW